MFQSIAEDIKQQFAYGNRITRLIILNTIVFVAIQLVRLFFVLTAGFEDTGDFDTFLRYISLNGDLLFDARHPWVMLTHMFVHVGFWHFLFNMLYLYWFGRITGDFLGDHRIYPLYLMSALIGAVLYLMTVQFFAPDPSTIPLNQNIAYGASAAVMGIVAAAGAIAPDYTIRLLFIGSVRLKYIVLVLVLLDVFAIGSLSNTGGHIAHLGGALFGFVFVSFLKQGTDLSEPVNRLFDWFKGLFNQNDTSRTPLRVAHKSDATKPRQRSRGKTQRTVSEQERIDIILEKIKKSGFESLTDEEKEFLFQVSKK